MSINDQIAELGSQLNAAILDAYAAVPGGGLASLAGHPLLAFLPGDITVPAASFVQPVAGDGAAGLARDGVSGPAGPDKAPAEAVNPMLVTAWLKSDDVGADTPLLLDTDQGTVIGGPPGGFTTMSELYFDLLEFAQPVAAAGSPEAGRLAQLLAWARAALPSSPDFLPLLTQPGNWPLPDTAGWNQFSFTSTSAPSPPTAGSQGARPVLLSSPWSQGLRFMPGHVLRVPPVLAPEPSSPEPAPTRPPGAGSVPVVRPVAAELTVRAIPAAGSIVTVQRPVIPVFLAGLAATAAGVDAGGNAVPPVQTAATQITLEHMLVAIDRSSWWHNDWLADPGWYVPGQPGGSSIASASGAGQVMALPVALVLVRNLTMTGSWSAADTTQLTSDGTLLGPFNLGGATAATNADNSVTITAPGPSVAALFCRPLPVLPPANPPASVPAS